LGESLVDHARKRDAIAVNASSGLPVAEYVRRFELGRQPVRGLTRK